VSAIVEHGNIEPEPVTEPVTEMQVLQRVVAMSSSSRVAPKLREIEIEIEIGPGHGLGLGRTG
jgi:C4-type Zn-finger protein